METRIFDESLMKYFLVYAAWERVTMSGIEDEVI